MIGQRHRKVAAAAAQVNSVNFSFPFAGPLQNSIDHQFGFRTGDKNLLVDRKLQAVKLFASGNITNRLPKDPPFNRCCKGRRDLFLQNSGALQENLQPVPPLQVCQQNFRFIARLFYPRLFKTRRSPSQSLFNSAVVVPQLFQFPTSCSCLAFAEAVRLSMISSRSPSSTRSSLCRVSPMR